MIFLDTAYLIALINPLDELHDRAKAWSVVVREPLVLTEQVLWETVNYFSRPVHRGTVHRMLDYVRSDSNYTIVSASADLLASGLKLHRERPDKSWSLTDCVSFVVMSDRGITRALTHDEHFQQAGFEAMLRCDPDEPH